MLGINIPEFLTERSNKAIGYESRIQYNTPFISNKEEKLKNKSEI